MKIEKFYYDEFQKTFEELYQAWNQKFSAMTEEEKAAVLAKTKESYRTTISEYEAQQPKLQKVFSQEKEQLFLSLAEDALWLAELFDYNIRVESKDTTGLIHLETDYLLYHSALLPEIKRILIQLLLNSEFYSISHREKTFYIEYYFDLFDVIETDEET